MRTQDAAVKAGMVYKPLFPYGDSRLRSALKITVSARPGISLKQSFRRIWFVGFSGYHRRAGAAWGADPSSDQRSNL
jgi:hypothetical protein